MLTLRSLWSSEPQVFWTQWRGHNFWTIGGSLSKTTVSYTLVFSVVIGLDSWSFLNETLSMKETWSLGCQSYEYTTVSKSTTSTRLLMGWMTSAPLCFAGQLVILRVPLMKSFWTSIMRAAETGRTIYKIKNKNRTKRVKILPFWSNCSNRKRTPPYRCSHRYFGQIFQKCLTKRPIPLCRFHLCCSGKARNKEFGILQDSTYHRCNQMFTPVLVTTKYWRRLTRDP